MAARDLLPFTVAVPLLAAAALAGLGPLVARRPRVLDGVAFVVAVAVAAADVACMAASRSQTLVYWLGGWRPAHGVAVGIDLAVDPVGAGLAAMAAVLVAAAMVFSWQWFDQPGGRFPVLVLCFLAGMEGFSLTGDLFDLFVFFELMGVAAYALTAYRPEERGPLQGALNFAITNSVGAYLSLTGIALLYGRTGALDMAQAGRALAGRGPSTLAVVAFVLIAVGLLTKASIVPFHWWLADAHAVAPTPVCMLFSGVMVELGLYGVARVWWSSFAGAVGHRGSVGSALVAMGVTTAVVGALFCFRQRHIKRLLAFSTISHAGMFLVGIGLMTPLGLGGAAVYVLSHGLVKAALFACAGVVLHRLGSIDEHALWGRGRHLRVTGVLFAVGGLALSDLPPFASYLGRGAIEAGSVSQGRGWLVAVLVVCSGICGGAVLRVAGGVFWGIGEAPAEDPEMGRADEEETTEAAPGERRPSRTPVTMLVPPLLLLAAAAALGLVPGLGVAVEHAAARLQDQAGYVRAVLGGSPGPGGARALAALAHPAAPEPADVSGGDIASGLGSAAIAVALAAAALHRRRLPLLARAATPVVALVSVARRAQSGLVADYVTWLVLGTATLGGALVLAVR